MRFLYLLAVHNVPQWSAAGRRPGRVCQANGDALWNGQSRAAFLVISTFKTHHPICELICMHPSVMQWESTLRSSARLSERCVNSAPSSAPHSAAFCIAGPAVCHWDSSFG